MAVVIRLARRGAKNTPFYHIVVTDSRNPVQGRFIEKIGYLDPRDKNNVYIDLDSLEEWVKKGAKMSDRVKSLVKKYKKGVPKQNETENQATNH